MATQQSAETASPGGRPKAAKQAVVIVHGMGEQRPMDTIKAFVKTVWEDDPDIAQPGAPEASKAWSKSQVWSKPDQRTGSLELRRVTTRESVASAAFRDGVRTDFYELYWADLSAGSTWDQVVNWIWYLLIRPWKSVPPPVRLAWWVLWAAAVFVAVMGLIGFLPEKYWTKIFPAWLPQWLFVAVSAVVAVAMHKKASATFGRVVRYTRTDPDNIAARAAIRTRGLDLLDALHRESRYRRIVIVGHSLGTMLAYDLLSYFWAQRSDARTVQEGTAEFAAFCDVETAAAAVDESATPFALDAYRRVQRQLRDLLAGRPAPDHTHPSAPDRRWLISDLVTLGSPLTHAEFLIASSSDDLKLRQAQRELPTAPPFRDLLDPDVLGLAKASGALPIATPSKETRLMSYPDKEAHGKWVMDHGSPFAVVRWTNLHDPASHVFRGDMISGPLRHSFGPVVMDIDLSKIRGASNSFTHTSYWSSDAPPLQLAALRRAVNLLDL